MVQSPGLKASSKLEITQLNFVLALNVPLKPPIGEYTLTQIGETLLGVFNVLPVTALKLVVEDVAVAVRSN